MWIKICANTSLEDAKLAAELGADALGFVFASSARQVTTEQVAAIVPHLPEHIEKIGVFTSQNASEIVTAVRTAGLTGVQLHGAFDLNLARRLHAELGDSTQIIQTLHWRIDDEGRNAEEIAKQLATIAQEPAIHRILVDSKTKNAAGGSGISFDWIAAHKALGDIEGKLIVAGGLQAENVAQAIRALRPWGVDVATGVEAVPGRKDKVKLKQFIQNARSSGVSADV